jgi:ABC-type polysaccharide transport system permease subunit
MGNRSAAPLLLRWATIVLGWLIPRFPLSQLPAMLAIAALGAGAASIYGVLHDQITYTISPEYFTRLKFEQFAWANLGLPPRMFVAQIGPLASWGIGLVGGWFVARAATWESIRTVRWPLVARAFGIVAIFTLGAGLIGWLLG